MIIGVTVLVILSFRRYLATEQGRLKWDTLKLKLPVVGNLTRKIAVARFARTLGTLTANGVPILQALLIVREVIGNMRISEVLVQVHAVVKEGGGLSGPLGESGVFPPMAVHMISIGEESARLEKMLLKIAEIFEADVRTTMDRLTSLLEPMIIIVMALVVGFIVLSMVTAMMSMNALTF
jgi:type II secretory pathway component PulF